MPPKTIKEDKPKKDNEEEKYHPFRGTSLYLEQKKPLKFMTEELLKTLEYSTRIKLSIETQTGNTYSKFCYFICYDPEKKAITYSVNDPWTLPELHKFNKYAAEETKFLVELDLSKCLVFKL